MLGTENEAVEGRLYSMKEACERTGFSYEALKFYCNEGLVPGVQRDRNNRRVFNESTVRWIESLDCLRNCNMSLAEMKQYLAYCLEGQSSIPERRVMLDAKLEQLLAEQRRIQEAIGYIHWKQSFYDDIESGKIPYKSNLVIPEDELPVQRT